MWQPTIYVLGNAYPFQEGLLGLAFLFNPANDLMTSSFGLGIIPVLGLIISLIFLTAKGISTQRVEVHNVLIMLVLYLVMFVPTTSVTVEVVTDQQVVGPINGIPIGVAYTAGLVSLVSTNFAEDIGTAFQPTSATQGVEEIFGPQGYMGPLTQLEAIHGLYNQFSYNDHYDVESMMAYMSHCESYNLSQATGASISGPATENQILNAGDAASAIFADPPTGLTVVYGPQYPGGSESMTCTNAAAAIQGSINAYMNNTNGAAHPSLNLSYSAMKLAEPVGPVAPTGDPEGASTLGADTIGSDLQTVFCSGSTGSQQVGCSLQSSAQTGVQFMENDILGCLFEAGLNYARNPTNGNITNALPGYCDVVSNALTVQQTNSATSATLFGINLMPMMSILQFMFLALTPLVALIMVSAGTSGISIAGKFIFFGIWTQSWLPVAALINDYAQDTISNTFAIGAQYALGLGGAGYSAAGAGNVIPYWTSIGSLSLFFQKLELQLNAANTMLGLTPVLTLAVFTGAFTAIGRLGQDMQGGSGAARGADGVLAPALGAPTMMGATGSFSAYQQTFAGDGSLGSGLSAVAEGGTATLTGGAVANAASSLGVSAVASASRSFGETVTRAATELSDAANSSSFQSGVGTAESASVNEAYKSALSIGQRLSKGTDITDQQRVRLAMLASANASQGLSLFGDGATARENALAEIGISKQKAQKIISNGDEAQKSDRGFDESLKSLKDQTSKALSSISSGGRDQVSLMDSQAGQVADAVRLNDSAQQTANNTKATASNVNFGIKEATQLAESTPGGWMTLNNRVMNGDGVSATDRQAVEQIASSPALRALYPTNAGQRTFAAALDYTTNNATAGGLAVSGAILGLVDPQAGAAIGQVSSRSQELQARMGGNAGSVIAGTPGGKSFGAIAGDARGMPGSGPAIRAAVATDVAVQPGLVDGDRDRMRDVDQTTRSLITANISAEPIQMLPASKINPYRTGGSPPSAVGGNPVDETLPPSAIDSPP
jgi:conjugal transfer mating pair stabilization protein TraG